MFMAEQVVDHYFQNVVHAGIGHRIKHLLAAPLPPQHARGTQQTEMVTNQRRGEPEFFCDVTRGYFALHADNHDRQPRRIGQQAKRFRELRYLVGLQFNVVHK